MQLRWNLPLAVLGALALSACGAGTDVDTSGFDEAAAGGPGAAAEGGVEGGEQAAGEQGDGEGGQPEGEAGDEGEGAPGEAGPGVEGEDPGEEGTAEGEEGGAGEADEAGEAGEAGPAEGGEGAEGDEAAEGAEGAEGGEGGVEMPRPRASIGDLVITEFFPNPEGRDNGAEYIELFNASGHEIDLHGLELTDLPTEAGNSNSWFINETLLMAADAYVLVGSLDGEGRSGVPVDHGYLWNDYPLTNTEDEIILKVGDLVIDEIRYDRSWGIGSGNVVSLLPGKTNGVANNNKNNWCSGEGSPGDPNPPCEPGGGEGQEGGEGDEVAAEGGEGREGGEGVVEGGEGGEGEGEGGGGEGVGGEGGLGADCEQVCDCRQGLGCEEETCAVVGQPQYCCDHDGCPDGVICRAADGSPGRCGGGGLEGVEGGEGPGEECESPCDCSQGFACTDGDCVDVPDEDTWCCENADPPCPELAQCVSAGGGLGRCPGLPGDPCDVACDCPAGQACNVDRCQQLADEVFCCDGEGECPVGEDCQGQGGQFGVCQADPGEGAEGAEGGAEGAEGAEGGEGGVPDCVTHCDCVQGEGCIQGDCIRGGVAEYCCGEVGCPGENSCRNANDAPGCCNGRPAGQCAVGGACISDCDCGGATPMCDAPNLGDDGVCTNQVPNNRAYCCNAQVCVNANQGEAAYNNICITQAGGQMQCGCCGVNNQNCCQF